MNKIEKYFKRYELTSYLGPTYEDSDRITCYIKKNRIKKIPSGYIIRCKNGQEDNQKGFVKPICYVLDNIEFDAPVIIEGDKNTEIIIKNSNLYSGLSISSKGKCIIDNCTIYTHSTIERYSASYLSISNTTGTTIETDRIYIPFQAKRSFITISLLADKIDINNFQFHNILNNSEFKLDASDEITISNNSEIEAEKINCKSKVLKMDNNSSLGSIYTEMLEINAEEYNELNLAGKAIMLNGIDVNNGQRKVTIKPEKNPIRIKRL